MANVRKFGHLLPTAREVPACTDQLGRCTRDTDGDGNCPLCAEWRLNLTPKGPHKMRPYNEDHINKIRERLARQAPHQRTADKVALLAALDEAREQRDDLRAMIDEAPPSEIGALREMLQRIAHGDDGITESMLIAWLAHYRQIRQQMEMLEQTTASYEVAQQHARRAGRERVARDLRFNGRMAKLETQLERAEILLHGAFSFVPNARAANGEPLVPLYDDIALFLQTRGVIGGPTC